MNESVIQNAIRLEAGKRDILLMRNNNGACFDETGRLIRYGLGNDSERINKVFKSSDLIGIQRVLITPEHVGQIMGVFIAVECKRDGWRLNGNNPRELAQLNFINTVIKYGGIAGFAASVDDFNRTVK